MIEELVELMKSIEANEEFFEVLARLMRKMYDALVKAGFSPEEAVKIVASQGTGLKTNS